MDTKNTEPTSRGAWLAVAVLAGGLFAAVVSTTVVSVALPTIGRELHAGATQSAWIVDAYVLVYASLLVAGGVIGDRRGRKGLFLIGVATFGLGALVTGVAPNTGVLLIGRVVQGLGPALLVPGSLTIIRAIFEEPGKRATAIGLWSTSSGLALAVGPALGGVIVNGLGWRWVFLVNVPFSALLVVLGARLIPRVERNPATSRFDWAGAVLSTLSMAAVAFGIIEGPEWGWASPRILAAFAAGLVALGLFVGWELRRPEPLVDIKLFRHSAFTVANVAAMIVFFAFVGAIVYFSAYFQNVQGHSPIEAGLDVSAIGVAFALAAPLSGRMVARIGPFWPMFAGLAVSGVATLGLLRLGPNTGIGAIWWDFALVGGGVGLSLTPMTTTAIASVEASRAGMASAVHNALRQLGQVLGVAILGVLVYAKLPHSHKGGGRLAPHTGDLFVTGLHHAIWVCGCVLLAAAAMVALLAASSRKPMAGAARPSGEATRAAPASR
ncbi:MFS transporter [Streptomyces camelliae]|uniref:MFS transporter n=1 Tax=Streptomyces camelliae TaxID=3004093 RepID=A0ABY7PGF6_9ACTN|nr:MFS transporter [Streptomyces sp. HUAS 2-6]WBO69710.1 MFS transporter [Streptomyces sp. HUAS 2-6]